MLKKLTVGLAGLVTAVGGALWAIPQADAVPESTPVTVEAGEGYRLNVRTEPSTDAPATAFFLHGSTAELLCRTEGPSTEGLRGATTNWYGVKGGGYVSGAWLAEEPELGGCGDAVLFDGKVTGFGGSLNVRQSADGGAASVGHVADGADVQASCWVWGSSHTNAEGRTSEMWLRLVEGYVSEAFVALAPTQGDLPICADAPAEPAPEQPAPEEPAPGQPAPEAPGFEHPFNGQFYLPFANGTSAPVSQGPWGSFSHNNANNYHAIDIALPQGTPLHAPGPGIIRVASDRGDGYGNTVYIDHGNNRCTQLAHLSEIGVGVGQEVNVGERVGAIGSTGQSTGPHLHWNIVACNGYESLEVPNTVEAGTTYNEGSSIVSQNPGA